MFSNPHARVLASSCTLHLQRGHGTLLPSNVVVSRPCRERRADPNAMEGEVEMARCVCAEALLRRLPAAAASGRAGGAQIWAAGLPWPESTTLPPPTLLPPLTPSSPAGGCHWVVHARGDPDGCCDAVPWRIPAAEAAGRHGAGDRCRLLDALPVVAGLLALRWPVPKPATTDVPRLPAPCASVFSNVLRHVRSASASEAMHEIAGVHQDELKHTPFRYFTFRIGDGAVQQNLKYMEEDDHTIIRMASLIYGVEQNLVITTHMLEENRRRLEFYQARVETLEERLVEANTSLVAAHEAWEAIEVAAEQAITAANVVLAMDNDDPQEIPPEDPTPTPRERLHPRMMITRTKKSILAKRSRLTLRAIAPSTPPTLPTPPTREEQLGDLQEEETEPEERVPATPEGTSSP
ncbi:hypothetical protein ZWY2020_000922 [Hordeum vulgare]|nr:hypothetical protein ZWY2020_000922 [Hordeum vulgare]